MRAWGLKGVSVGLLLSTGSCKNRPRDSSPDSTGGARLAFSRALPSCRKVHLSTTAAWRRVMSSDRRVSLRLPSPNSVVHSGTPETWAIPGGSISYRIASDNEGWRDSIRVDVAAPSRGWCEEVISGVHVLIQYAYSRHAATGAGYYLVAYWPIVADSAVRVIGFQQDSARGEELLAIAQTVQRQ
jgi:hypothetical protein